MAGIGQHGHVFPVLGARAHHGGAADVDVLNGVGQRAAGLGHRRFERIQVHAQDVDGADAMLVQRRHVCRQVAPREQAAMDFGVQRLDAAIEHFRKTGVIGHLGHGQSAIGQQFGCPASRQEFDAQGVQVFGEFDDACLVRHGQEGGEWVHDQKIQEVCEIGAGHQPILKSLMRNRARAWMRAGLTIPVRAEMGLCTWDSSGLAIVQHAVLHQQFA